MEKFVIFDFFILKKFYLNNHLFKNFNLKFKNNYQNYIGNENFSAVMKTKKFL